MERRRRSARKARWFGVYTAVLFALAVVVLVAGQISVGLTVLAFACVFAFVARGAWRSSRR